MIKGSKTLGRSTVQKFSGGGSGFDPGFSETEKVRARDQLTFPISVQVSSVYML